MDPVAIQITCSSELCSLFHMQSEMSVDNSHFILEQTGYRNILSFQNEVQRRQRDHYFPMVFGALTFSLYETTGILYDSTTDQSDHDVINMLSYCCL
jgi:hypothetical protein